MKINYNDLERIYIAAKDCSMGAMEELTCELNIVQNAKTLVVFKGDKINNLKKMLSEAYEYI